MTTTFKNKLASNVGTNLTITAVTPSSPSAGSVTLTFAAQTAIPFPVGTTIHVVGLSVSGYNGVYTVTGCTTTTVTFVNATTTAGATGGTIYPNLITTNGTATTTVLGLSITNTTGGIILVSVLLQDTVANTSAYFAQNVIVPLNTTVRLINGGERLVLSASTYVDVFSSTLSSADVVMSWVEIS